MKLRLHTLILLGLAAGVVLGLVLHQLGPRDLDPAAAPTWWRNTIWTLDLFGQTMFVGALRMLIAPLIFASIIAAVTSLPRLGDVGAIGVKTLTFYIATTAVAILIALTLVLTLQPGRSAPCQTERDRRTRELSELRTRYERETAAAALASDGRATPDYLAWLEQKQVGAPTMDPRFAAVRQQAQRTPAEIFKEDILLGMLRNPLASLTTGNALGIIFFALLLGVACTAIGPPGQPVAALFSGLSAAMLKITHWVMLVSPLAVLCIMARLVAETGPDVFGSLGWFCGTVIAAIGTHVVFLVGIAWTLGGVNPAALWRGCRDAMLIALSTRSSAATLPVTLACAIEKLRVSPRVANFALPIGATINMDGTAIHQATSVIFLLQLYGGLEDVTGTLTPLTLGLIAVMSGFAAMGAAPMPNAGLVIMAMVASVGGLPVYYLPFVFAVDAVLDMFRTVVNVLGDVTGAVVVNRLERSRLAATDLQAGVTTG